MIAVALLVLGVFVLIKREIKLTRNLVVEGKPAIAIGLIFVLLLPVSFCLGIGLGIVGIGAGMPQEQVLRLAVGLDWGLIILAVLSSFIIAFTCKSKPEEPKTPFPTAYNETKPPADPDNPYSAPMDRFQ